MQKSRTQIAICVSLAVSLATVASGPALAGPGTSLQTSGYSVKAYGAVGDGITNDTRAIQRAIYAANKAGGGVVFFPTATYLLKKAGAKSMVLGSATTLQQPYCLEMRSGVTLDLNGSILKLANGQNAALIVNRGLLYTNATDTNMTISNGVLDVNNDNQTVPTSGSMHAIGFINVANVHLQDLRFDRVRDGAVRLIKAEQVEADNLYCTSSDGDAFEIGQYSPTALYDMRVKHSTFGTLRAENCLNGVYPVTNSTCRQGNPVVVTAVDCVFDQWLARSCGGGFKIQDGSLNVSVKHATFDGPAAPTAQNATTNSGLKIQGGAFPGYEPRDVSVGEVVSSGCCGSGLYIQAAANVSVGSYIGTGNATGPRPDVWIGQVSGCHIGSVVSTRSGQGGVMIRSDALNYQIDQINVTNCGQVSRKASGVQVLGGVGHINSVFIHNDPGSPVVTRGLSIPVSTALGGLDYLEVSGASSSVNNLSPQFRIGTVVTGAPTAR
jgi:Pectate lyase superfamily protein